MASSFNSFDLLKGAESTLQSKKKKKQNKPAENGHASTENGSSSVAESGRANGVAAQVDVYEAVAILERAAREARTIADKCKLWKDWIRQAGDRSSKLKYKDVDGATLDFRQVLFVGRERLQVLLRSRALEISLEGAMGAGLTVEREELLSQLLLTFSCRFDARAAQSMAQSLVRLSTLTEDEALDVKGAAQRAVYGVISSCKAASGGDAANGADAAAVSSWMGRVSSLGQSIAKDQGMLQKLASAGRGAATKEHADMARKIFRQTGEQFDLLQTESLPSLAGGAADSYAPALELLRSAINSKIQQSATADKPKGNKGGDAASKQQALASLRKEEAIVSQQVDAVAAQIRTLEAQLRTLRSQQQELDDKRTQLQQRMRLANDPSAQGKKGSVGVAHHQEELGVVDTIHTILMSTDSHGAESDQVLTVQAAGQSVSGEYVAAGRQFLGIAKAALAEVPGKVTFCKQRIAQAERLLKLGSKDNQKIKDDADKLMADTVRGADDLLRTSLQVHNDLNSRVDAVLRSLPDSDHSVSEALMAVEQLMMDIRTQYEAVQQMLRPPAPPAPVPVAVAAPVSNGKAPHHAPRPVSAAPPAAPVPAVAPQPVFAAASPPNAFDAAAAYLAGARPLSAPVGPRSESPVAAPVRKPAPPVAVTPAPVRAAAPASSSAPRQWGKPAGTAGAAAAGEDTNGALPTPAEAFKVPGAPPAASTSGGEETKKKRANKPRA